MPKHPFHLLLVEDEPADAALFEELLLETSPGISVHHAQHGRDALALLTREPGFERAPRPDLVVLDLNMPVMNGHEFLARVKAIETLRSIPVLVLSTSDHPSDVYRAYDRFASGYVVKPATYQEYTRVLETIDAYWKGLMQLPTLEQVGGDA